MVRWKADADRLGGEVTHPISRWRPAVGAVPRHLFVPRWWTDLYIAARQLTGPSSPGEAHQWLAGVLSSVLGRPVTASRSA